MQEAIFHPRVKEILKTFPLEIRKALGKAILDLQKGHHLTQPLSKPMPSVGLVVDELRVKDATGAYRAFYYKKYKHGILVFHAFVKKTQKTQIHEINLGKKRLQEMLL